MWFDSENGMSRVDRTNGRYDPFCGTVLNATTPCTQLVRDGKRYMIYPFVRTCCQCCDSEHGCGIMRRDWLKEASFVGKDELSGQFFNKWNIEGRDYWSAITDQQTPRKLVEGGQIFKDFIMNTYSEENIEYSIFALPSYCTGAICSATSVCGKFRSQ